METGNNTCFGSYSSSEFAELLDTNSQRAFTLLGNEVVRRGNFGGRREDNIQENPSDLLNYSPPFSQECRDKFLQALGRN